MMTLRQRGNNNEKGFMKSCFKGGFTLIELLVVIAIIMILAGLLFPVFSTARLQARKTKAKSEVRQLDVAWKAVLSDHRTWGLAGVTMGDALQMDLSKVTYLQKGNPKKILYMEFPSGSVDFKDPWGGIYNFALGLEKIQPQGYGELFRDVGAWSLGPSGNTTVTAEHITSWK
jgi:prepilin-type N-terminal cleavage/methylation domain-containing protein